MYSLTAINKFGMLSNTVRKCRSRVKVTINYFYTRRFILGISSKWYKFMKNKLFILQICYWETFTNALRAYLSHFWCCFYLCDTWILLHLHFLAKVEVEILFHIEMVGLAFNSDDGRDLYMLHSRYFDFVTGKCPRWILWPLDYHQIPV
jgi:hypothetical protein